MTSYLWNAEIEWEYNADDGDRLFTMRAIVSDYNKVADVRVWEEGKPVPFAEFAALLGKRCLELAYERLVRDCEDTENRSRRWGE